MSNFCVWAPTASRVDLVLKDERRAMRRGTHGHWALEAGDAVPGSEYAYSIDGASPRPDPRSHWQPHGVHGLSRVVEHAAFAWKRGDFRAPPPESAVIYELHVGTFTEAGTLDAAVERLAHLVELGVTHVELMPINAFDGAHGWGYDGVCWFAPHPAYTGRDGPDAVKRFVDACHGRGLAVLLDVVYNHLGPSGNYLAEFGPYFSDAYSTPWGPAINLDGPGSDEVRRAICDSALMWLRDYRIDGLRLDAVHAFFDRSAVHLLEQLTTEIAVLQASQARPLVIIAESDLNDPRLVRPRTCGGLGCDAQWSDDYHHAIHAVLTGEREGYYSDFGSLSDLAQALTRAFVYDGRRSESRQRSHGRPVGEMPGACFLAYAQNHDQIGNRAQGDRLSGLVDDGHLRIAAALTLLSPFVPMLFQGEEWGTRRPFQYFTDHADSQLAQAVRDGRRSEFAHFGWDPEQVPDPQDPETFLRSKLDWAEVEDERCRELLDWHQALIRLRRLYPELTDGRLDRTWVRFDESLGWLSMRRGSIAVACNFGSDTVPLRPADTGFVPRGVLLASAGGSEPAEQVLNVPPHGVVIAECDASEESR